MSTKKKAEAAELRAYRFISLAIDFCLFWGHLDFSLRDAVKDAVSQVVSSRFLAAKVQFW